MTAAHHHATRRALASAQASYDNAAPVDAEDDLRDTISRAIEELHACQSRLDRGETERDPDAREKVAAWVREIAGWMQEAHA